MSIATELAALGVSIDQYSVSVPAGSYWQVQLGISPYTEIWQHNGPHTQSVPSSITKIQIINLTTNARVNNIPLPWILPPTITVVSTGPTVTGTTTHVSDGRIVDIKSGSTVLGTGAVSGSAWTISGIPQAYHGQQLDARVQTTDGAIALASFTFNRPGPTTTPTITVVSTGPIVTGTTTNITDGRIVEIKSGSTVVVTTPVAGNQWTVSGIGPEFDGLALSATVSDLSGNPTTANFIFNRLAPITDTDYREWLSDPTRNGERILIIELEHAGADGIAGGLTGVPSSYDGQTLQATTTDTSGSNVVANFVFVGNEDPGTGPLPYGVIANGYTITVPDNNYWQIQDSVTFAVYHQANGPYSFTLPTSVDKVHVIDITNNRRIEDVQIPA